MPQLRAGFAVDCVAVIPRSRYIHDTVDNKRCAFKAIENTRLKGPNGDQSSDVFGVDLIESAVAMAVISPAVHEPVGIITTRLQEVGFVDTPDQFDGRLLNLRGRFNA